LEVGANCETRRGRARLLQIITCTSDLARWKLKEGIDFGRGYDHL
jgi:hypothetical protein